MFIMHNFSIYKDTTFSQTHHNKTPTKQAVFTNSQNTKFTKPPLPLIASEKPPASHRGNRFCRLHHPQKKKNQIQGAFQSLPSTGNLLINDKKLFIVLLENHIQARSNGQNRLA